MVKIFRSYEVGQVVQVKSIDRFGCALPARRTVNADGSPRSGLTSVRVVKRVTDSRRFTLEMIADGAAPCDHVLAEVCS